MGSMTGTTVLEQVVVNNDQDDSPRCEWNDCKAKATHWLICPVCGAREYQCTPHSDGVKNAPIGNTILFNCTCQHTVLAASCGIEPL